MAKQQRKIVFFLGAGASYGAGSYAPVQAGGRVAIPTQATFWDTFLRFSRSKRNRRDIESFLFRYFLGYARVPARSTALQRRKLLKSLDVEEVFTFLSERARAPSTSAALRGYAAKVWSALIAEIGNVFVRFQANADTRRIYRQLTRNFVRSRDTIVSFNYDTVFERSLPASYRWHYEGLETATSSIGLLKPHGSINWEDADPIAITESPARPLVVAPTHLKFVQTVPQQAADTSGYLDHAPGLQNVWRIMEREMSEAKALVFIGYSFPLADLYFSSVLRSVLADRDGAPGVAIVNPDAVAISERLQTRFALNRVGNFFDLQTFVQGTRFQLLSQIS
jgi:hypothetical protein